MTETSLRFTQTITNKILNQQAVLEFLRLGPKNSLEISNR